VSVRPFSLVAGVVASGLAGCNSTPQPSVCSDIGVCSEYVGAAWVQTCQSETDLLQQEVTDGGCGAQFNAYYSCASANFACVGTAATFPGCDTQRSALDGCLEQIKAGTYCAQLAAQKSACGALDSGAAPDAGTTAAGDAGDGGIELPSCSFGNDCQAECYVTNVSNECTPAVDQLQAAALCILGCPQ
jgi:hypothetical protein